MCLCPTQDRICLCPTQKWMDRSDSNFASKEIRYSRCATGLIFDHISLFLKISFWVLRHGLVCARSPDSMEFFSSYVKNYFYRWCMDVQRTVIFLFWPKIRKLGHVNLRWFSAIQTTQWTFYVQDIWDQSNDSIHLLELVYTDTVGVSLTFTRCGALSLDSLVIIVHVFQGWKYGISD